MTPIEEQPPITCRLTVNRRRLEGSLDAYRAPVRRTAGTCRYANTLQTAHRRIPVRGWKDHKLYDFCWQHMLPQYEEELARFKQRVADLGRQTGPAPPLH
jgi:hypothetical protein